MHAGGTSKAVRAVRGMRGALIAASVRLFVCPCACYRMQDAGYAGEPGGEALGALG